jgi:hypothetical protein
LEDKNLGRLGLLYIRIPELRSHIEKHLVEAAGSPESKSGAAYPDLAVNFTFHVNNSCRLEWDTLIRFWRTVVIPNKPILKARGLCEFVADTVLLAFKERSCRTGNYLSFFGHFLKSLETADDMNFSLMHADHVNVVKTIVALILGLYSPRPEGAPKKGLSHTHLQAKGHIFQQALISILELVEWIVVNVEDYEAHVKGQIMEDLRIIPELVQWPSGAGCFPLYSTIIGRLDGQKALASKIYEHPNTGELLKNHTMTNLEDIY